MAVPSWGCTWGARQRRSRSRRFDDVCCQAFGLSPSDLNFHVSTWPLGFEDGKRPIFGSCPIFWRGWTRELTFKRRDQDEGYGDLLHRFDRHVRKIEKEETRGDEEVCERCKEKAKKCELKPPCLYDE